MKKTLSIILAALTVFSCFAFTSCKDDAKETLATTTTDPTVDTTPPEYLPDLSATDWGGKTFNMLTHSGFWGEQMDREATSEDPVTTAIYDRNRAIEARYNITINEVRNENANTVISDAFKSGIDDYHCVVMPAHLAGPLSSTGVFYDLAEIENLNLEKHYWDQTAKEDMAVDGKIFYATGDLCVSANMATFLMLYNKNLANKYGIEDDYVQMVRDGKWTMDYFIQQVAQYGYAEKDGDGVPSLKDSYGLAVQDEAITAFYFGMGGTIVDRDDANMPRIRLNNQYNKNIIESVYKLVKDGNHTINTHDWVAETGSATQDFASVKAFIEGRSLFFSSNASNMEVFRDMEDDFIVLPFPKNSEKQKNYKSFVYNGANMVSIPVTNKKEEETAFTGFVLEALAAESYKTVTPAYYEKTLKGKYQRDERSFEMLDVVFRNRVWDMGYICNFGDIAHALPDQIKVGSGTFSSFCRTNERKLMSAINDYVSAYEKADK